MRRRTVALLPLFAFLFIAVGTASSAVAADEVPINIRGQLNDTRTKPAEPVPGVTINVTQDGAVIATGTSGADGTFEIPLPGSPDDLIGQKITIDLDTSTLPEGTKLTDEKKSKFTVLVKTNFDIPINYAIGPGDNDGVPLWREATQSGFNGVVLGLVLALCALGVSLVFGTTGLANFAHGELVTFGALVAFFFQSQWGWNFFAAAIIALIVAAGFGYLNDKLLWKPLRSRGTDIVAMMIVSIGLAIFLRNIYQYFFGANAHQFKGVPAGDPWSVGGIGISPKSFYVAIFCAIILVLVSLAVTRTRLGKATRAVSDNPALAASSGIDVDRIIATVWITGAALAAMGGMCWGLLNGFDYQTGNKILLLVFAAVTLGGLGTIWGTMAGSIIVGLLVEMSSMVLPPELKYVSAYVALVLILLIRPQGLLGRAERIG